MATSVRQNSVSFVSSFNSESTTYRPLSYNSLQETAGRTKKGIRCKM